MKSYAANLKGSDISGNFAAPSNDQASGALLVHYPNGATIVRASFGHSRQAVPALVATKGRCPDETGRSGIIFKPPRDELPNEP